jgi:hypothetical protein
VAGWQLSLREAISLPFDPAKREWNDEGDDANHCGGKNRVFHDEIPARCRILSPDPLTLPLVLGIFRRFDKSRAV